MKCSVMEFRLATLSDLEVLMSTWIFMLCRVLIIPILMIVIGKRAMNYEVKDDLDISKYRRKKSIKGEKESF